MTDGTYIGFLVLTFLGACLAWFLVDAKKIVRPDGSKVIIMKNPTWKSELLGLWEVLKTDIHILLLFPMFFASNWFYTYQFNDVNSAYFNTRTRALNGVLYWTAQIFGAAIFGYCLDINVRRSIRARYAWGALFTLTMVIWGGGFDFQKGYTREDATAEGFTGKDWSDSGYVGPMFLYIFYGFYDAAWQTCVYWFMGSLTNNGRKLANYAGFYKGIQSTGAAIIWRLDGLKVPFINLFASSWALLAAALLFAFPLIMFKVKDHIDMEQDLAFSDETMQDVAATTQAAADSAPAPAPALEEDVGSHEMSVVQPNKPPADVEKGLPNGGTARLE